MHIIKTVSKIFLLASTVVIVATTSIFLGFHGANFADKYLTNKPRGVQSRPPLGRFSIDTSGSTLKNTLQKVPKLYVVQSGSMEPVIETASVIASIPQNSYQKGDIITFAIDEDNKTLLTHRIEAKLYPDGTNNEPVFLTSGDANKNLDRWEVKNEQIVGKVFLSIPHLGYLVEFSKQPYGFILLVIVPATIIVYEEARSIFFKFKKSILKKRGLAKSERKPLPKISALIPVVGVIIVFVGFTSSFFSDTEKGPENVFSAAESFEEVPSPTPTPTPTQEPTHPVINEVMIHPSDNYDWVELYNPSPSAIDLNGWTLDDETGTFVDLTQTIDPHSYLTFTSYKRLNNGGDTVMLKNDVSQIIDEYLYTSDPGTDISVGRDPDGTEGFKTCTTASKGTSNNSLCP